MRASRRLCGMIRRLAFWRRTPGAPRGAGALNLLATLGLVLPLLAAVTILYTTQIIPDFDDYDWDGPDDDAWDDRKVKSIVPQPGGHGPARVVAILPTGPGLHDSASPQTPEKTPLAVPVGQRLRDAVSSRGPPSGANTNRGVRNPGRCSSPTSGNRTAFEVAARYHERHQEDERAGEDTSPLNQRAEGRALMGACPGPTARQGNNTLTIRRPADRSIPARVSSLPAPIINKQGGEVFDSGLEEISKACLKRELENKEEELAQSEWTHPAS